ncbi:MAG: hypothetical protein ACU0BB_04610 [Paracoccaceae bacterium]
MTGQTKTNGLSLLVCLRTAVTIGFAVFGTTAAAQATIQGSCDAYFDLPTAVGDIERDGTVTRSEPLAVIRDGAEVFSDPDGNSRVNEQLGFGERVFVTREENGYFSLNRDTREPDLADIGWIHGRDLLCNNLPILNEKGISRKFYVRTEASYSDEGVTTIKAKAGPETEECSQINGRCFELTRFTLFFIFAIDEGSNRVLLLGSPLNEGDTPLIGWVNIDDGYLWDTRYGLRPSENLVFDEATGNWRAGEERRACLYQTLEEAENASEEVCYVPVLGGNRWFNYSLRIPVFERVEHNGEHYFKVALPSAGLGKDSADDVLTQVKGLDEAIRVLQALRKLDVFFLLDGTQSMQPHIDSIVGAEGKEGVLESIQTAFANDPRFDGVQIRYGYRVYRDHYAGYYGIGEGMPFDQNCDPTEDELKANYAQFQSEVKTIDTQFAGDGTVRDTDHEENMILGLAFAADDMVSCPEHVKLMFVVGDTGYDLETQIERGTPIGSEDEVLSYLTQGFSTDLDPIIPFFIQVPQVTGLSASYGPAYEKFTQQGRFFAERIGQHFTQELKGNSEINIGEHFFSLDGRNPETAQIEMVNYVLDRVSKFGDQRPINEIIAELQGGAALVDIISTLQGGDSNVPALRLAQIEKRICDELGSACTERVFNDITDGYIRDDEDIRLDVWVDSDEFQNWKSKLDLLKNTNQVEPLELSRIIVRMMVDGLEKTIGELSPSEMNMSMAEFLKLKHGLPTGSQTPLLNYTINDFLRSEDGSATAGQLVEICELYRVARWLERHREIFASVNNSEVPLFNLEPVDPASCDMRYSTPELKFDGRERFPEDSMSFRQAQMNRSIFWLPNGYLP